MLKSIQWDIYTILMVAMVPAMLLTAWGLERWDASQLHRRQCEMAVEWLEESTVHSQQFQLASSMGSTRFWIAGFEEISSPNAAGNLRWGILQSARYHAEYFPNLPTNEPGVLNPRNGLFERQIEEGAAELVDHCPETEGMIADAFPMIFREDDT